MDFFQVVNKRKAIRNFIPHKKIPLKDIRKIIKTVDLAPSAGNLQAYKVFVVEDEFNRERLYKACYNQRSDFIKNASLILVFCTDPDQSKEKYGKRGEELYTLQDTTIAATFIMLAATALGYASCWVGSFKEQEICKILNTSLKPVAAITIGYTDENPVRPKRKPLSALIKYLENKEK